jgi:hypothetical protein
MTFHAPTRRELLLASGTLFAWAYTPKLASPKAAIRACW